MSYHVCFSFSMILIFLAILQSLECAFLIFHFFSVFLPYSRSYSVHFSFFSFFSVSRHISHPTVCFSHFPWFSLHIAILQVPDYAFHIFHILEFFSPYSRSNCVCVSFCTFFSVSCHIPGSTMCISFFMFLSVSRHTPDQTVFVSHFTLFSVFLAIFQVLAYLCLTFHVS